MYEINYLGPLNVSSLHSVFFSSTQISLEVFDPNTGIITIWQRKCLVNLAHSNGITSSLIWGILYFFDNLVSGLIDQLNSHRL